MPKRGFIIGAIVVAAAAIAWLSFGGIGENLVYYWTPTELLEAGAKARGATVRLGGQVKVGTLDWKKEANDLNFVVSDGKNDVRVHASSVPPQMFREGIGVVVEGQVGATGIFESQRLLVKHGNEYQPPEKHNAQALKKLMRSAVDE